MADESTSRAADRLLSLRIAGTAAYAVFCFFASAGAFWLPTTRFGIHAEWFTLLVPLLFLAALIAVPVSLGLAIARRRFALWCLLAAMCSLAAIYLGLPVGRQWRMAAFHDLADRSGLLVAAIREFEDERGQPPQHLDDLVPRFISRVPSTGMGGYPTYNYFVGADAEEYGGNRWALEVFTPGPGINFDRFLYYPDQNYPETGFSGSLERIGDWAYVHE